MVISRSWPGLGCNTGSKTTQRTVSLTLPQRWQSVLQHFAEMDKSSKAEDGKEHTYSPFNRPSWDY